MVTGALTHAVMGGYQRGWFSEGTSRLYVNRGIGFLGLPVRFMSRPEITMIDLQSSPASNGGPPVTSSVQHIPQPGTAHRTRGAVPLMVR